VCLALVNKKRQCSVHPLISPKILLLCSVVNRYHPPPPFISASETSYSLATVFTYLIFYLQPTIYVFVSQYSIPSLCSVA
jgi:hypothetical protein